MMKKKFLLVELVLLIIVIVLQLTSCSRNDGSPIKADDLDIVKKMAMKGDDKDEKLLSGNLDTLWILSSDFVKLNPKLTFRFYDTLDAFTLHGWLGNSNSHNNRPPDTRLFIGRKSSIQFGSGCYFGNLVLNAQSLNKVQKLIRDTRVSFVLFAPQDPAANGGQVVYNIFLTNDDPKSPTFYSISLIETGEFTNPSPPRNDDNLPPQL